MAANGQTRIFAGAGHGEGKSRNTYRGGLYRRSRGDGEWRFITDGLPKGVEVRAIVVRKPGGVSITA